MSDWEIRCGDVLDRLAEMPDNSVHCVVSSPPYLSLRDYGLAPSEWPEVTYSPLPGMAPITIPPMSCCFGLDGSIEAFIGHLVHIGRELWRVLRNDGTFFCNLGDSYVAGPTGHQDISAAHGKAAEMFAKGGRYRVDNLRKDSVPTRGALKQKDLMMVPARAALALQADGWYLRSDIIWCKRAPMPESVTDRPTTAHEHIFLLTKNARYYYDQEAVRILSSDASRGAIGTTTGSTTLGPEVRATLHANYGTSNSRGWVNFGEAQIPIMLSVALEAQGFEVVQLIGVKVGIETPEGHFMVNLERLSKPTLHAPMPIPIKSRLSLFGPVWASVPDAATAPSGAILTSHIGTYPISRTLLAAKVTAFECALVSGELFAAYLTIEHQEGQFTLFVWSTLWSAHVGSFVPEDSKSITQIGTSRNLWSYWLLSPEPFPAAHFATFPTEIPRRAILAGTSEHGVCAVCGAGWKRVVERTGHVNKREPAHAPNNCPTKQDSTGWAPLTRATDEWTPTCTCNTTEVVPATVLDPFSGAGTTVLVANRLGRRGIGIELNPVYVAMSQERIINDAPMFASPTPNGHVEQEEQAELWSA